MNNTVRISETGIEKIILHTEKVKSIIHNDDMDKTYPVSVELTLTNRCNLNCCYCSDKDLRNREGIYQELELNEAKRLFSDLKEGGTKGIVIEGGGEPTLHRDFDAIVQFAKKIGLSVGLITNGTQVIDKNVLKEFQWIRVSLDASNSREYKNIKGVDAFENVLSNIALYKKYCGTVGVGYVVTKNNIEDIDNIICRLRALGVNYVQLRPVVDNDELMVEISDFDYLKQYEDELFIVDVSGFKNNNYSGNGGAPCYASSITSVISGSGDVYICGRLNIYDWVEPIGNIKKESFKKIWYGEKRKSQLRTIKNADFCKNNCPQCRISKYNMFFDGIKKIKTVDFI